MAAPSLTAQDLITGAMRSLLALQPGEVPEGTETQEYFNVLNVLMDDFAAQRLTVFTTPRIVKNLAALQQTYTIGAGAEIDVVRPEWVAYAGCLLNVNTTPPTEIPLNVFTIQQYASIRIKNLQSALPQIVYYDHSFDASGLGRITLYPVPNVGYLGLVLYLPQQLATFADLATPYIFPPAYARMLRYNLAVELAPMAGVDVPPIVFQRAVDSLGDIKRANANQTESLLVVDRGLLGWNRRRSWNWRTGDTV